MGFFVQSSHGVVGNFEVVVPRVGGGLDTWWRDNDSPGLPWHGPVIGFGSPIDVGGVGLIQSTFGAAGNLEVVFREGSQLVHTWRDDGQSWTWKNRALLPGSVPTQGGVSLIQGRFGGTGNFEAVAPLAGGGLGHWWRDNDSPGLPWHGPTPFGTGQFDGVAVIHSRYDQLEVVATTGDQLVHWSRGADGAWTGSSPVASGVAGEPAFVQGTFGNVGNFEVVAPLAGGGLGHWWRDNDSPGLPWHGPTTFGAGQASAVGLIQSLDGNLDLVVRYPDTTATGGHLEHWWRDAGGWHLSTAFGADPATDPSRYGTSTIPYGSGIVGIHAALLHTGDVLLFSFADTDDTVGESRVLDPVTGLLTTPAGSHDLFCSGHAFLPDGRLLVAGGHHHDVKGIHLFDPATGVWSHHQNMPHGRWYPTCAALPDGQILVISGTENGGPVGSGNPVNNTLQFLPAGAAQEEPLPSPFSTKFPPSLNTIDLYPFVYVLPSGRLLVHSRHVTRFYDPATHSWDAAEIVTNHPFSRTYPGEGSSVLLPLRPSDGYLPRIMIIGGGGANPETLTASTPATNTAEILELNGPSPTWRSLPSMVNARVMPDATLLPDGTVLVIGGSATGKADEGINPVLPYELFDPATETWTTLRTMHVPRLYHSSALLLPDASVLILGKDGIYNPDPYHYPEHRAEIFKPPYLFRGPRPVVASVPSQATPGEQFVIGCPTAATVTAVNLLRPGAVTHSFNMEQRLIGLEITAHTATTLTVKAPSPAVTVAWPGYYLLYLIAAGVPSVGHIIQLVPS